MKGRGNSLCADLERTLICIKQQQKKERWKVFVDSSPVCVTKLGDEAGMFVCICLYVHESD